MRVCQELLCSGETPCHRPFLILQLVFGAMRKD